MAKKPLGKQQQQMIMISIASIVVLYLLYANVWRPFTKNIKQVEQNLEEVNKKLSEVNNFIIRRKEFEAYKKWYEDMLYEIKKRLPSSVEIPILLRKITEIANRSNVNIISISPEGVSEQEYLKELSYTVQTEGNYHTAASFFAELGNTDRIIDIYDVQMSPLGTGTEGKTVSFSFTFKTYVFKEAS